MNPLVVDILSSTLRKILAMASVWAVNNGIFTTDEAGKIVEAVILITISVMWTLWKNYSNRIKFLTALESPAGTSESTVKEKIANKLGATL